MRALASTVFASALLSVAPSLEAAARDQSAFDHARLARQALERHIRPGYQRLVQTTKTLDEAVSAHCGRKGGARVKIEEAFDAVVTAWGRVEHIVFGPVAAEQRYERIMFWPDRRGIGARQVAKALRERSPDVLDAGRLSKKSVGMQGLPALEIVLLTPATGDAKDSESAQFRCGFAKAIAINLADMAQSIEAEWSLPDGFAKSWLSPGPSNIQFLKPVETTIALAKALDHGLERLRDQRIGGPLTLNPQRRRIEPALGTSGRSMRLIVANIAGLRELYVQGGMEQALIEAKADDPDNTKALARLISQELATAQKTATALMNVKDPFARASARRTIALGFPLKNARSTAATLLAAVTDLPLGFNASDGD